MGHLDNISTPTLLGLALGLWLVYRLSRTLYLNVRISKLGARAPVRKSYLPMGLDVAYEAVNAAMQDKSFDMWKALFEKWGKGGFTIEAGIGERVILTAEPENIKAILATQFKDYGKGEKFRIDWHPFLGNGMTLGMISKILCTILMIHLGIFTTDGQLWHNSRQLIRPQFIKDRLSDIDIFEHHTQILLSKIVPGQTVDTMDLMFRFTLDAATDFLLGKSVDSLQHPQVEFADAFYNAQRIQSLVARVG